MDPYNDPTVAAPISPDSVYNLYQQGFDAAYAGNRAPFGVYTHPMWLVPSNNPSTSPVPDGSKKLEAVQKFLAYAMGRPDVWMVTHQQLIEYMKNPVSAAQLGSQSYMQCNKPAPPSNICNGVGVVGAETCPLPGGTFSSCYGCPASYPTLESPAPKSSKCGISTSCDTTWWDPATCTCLCTSSACEFKDTGRPVNLSEKSLDNVPPGGKKDPNSNGASISVSIAGALAVAGILLAVY